VATCVKVPSGFQVVAQGGKLNSSSPSLPGVAAGVADVQPAVIISFHKMAANQASCPSTLQAAKSSSLTVRTVQVEGASLLCNVACGFTRPLVPLVDRLAVFHAIHSVAHPGIRATRRMVSARFVWKSVGRDMAAMCRDCQQCKSQRGKVHKQLAAPLQAIHVHVDLAGPLPASSDGHMYLLTIIDRSTRWFEAVPLQNIKASKCADAFIANWVVGFGVPATVTTDRGAQFTSTLWTAACTSLGIKHVLTVDHMYVRVCGQQRLLAAPYAGPYLVVSKGAKTFTIHVGQRLEIISVDRRLKAHTGLGPVSPAEAASRGRPPNMPAAPSVQPAPS
jgi:hypothetical protein